MKRNVLRYSSSVLVVAAIGMVLLVNAGSLTPPGGPVAPTMKTLQQVEPRTDVQTLSGDAGNLHIITLPGSYYLTANVTGTPGLNGIQIDADDVTLDLRGFTLTNGGGAGTGIWVSNIHQNVKILNGSVTSWGTHGIDAGSAYNSSIEGIRAANCGVDGIRTWYSCTVKDCVAQGNQNNGYTLGNSNAVSHCTAVLNWADGFTFGYTCSFANCVSESNANRGFAGVDYPSGPFTTESSTLTNCTASYNASDGFTFGNSFTFNNCSSQHNGARGFGGDLDGGESGQIASRCTFLNCTAADNSNDGFFVGDGASFNNCSSIQNGFAPAIAAGVTSQVAPRGQKSSDAKAKSGGTNGLIGFTTDGINCRSHCTVVGCTLANNTGNGLEGYGNVTVSDSTVSGNWSYGLWFDSGVVTHSTIQENGSDGINVFLARVTVIGCTLSWNSGNGIMYKESCKVEGCTVSNNGQGGIVADTGADPEASGCQIRNNLVRRNVNDGILVISNSVVEGNNCVENGGQAGGDGAGIKVNGSGNRIDNNHLMRNDRGVEVAGQSNIITREAASGNTTNYVIAANNTVAAIVAAPVSGAISGSTGGAGIGTTDPWGNVSY